LELTPNPTSPPSTQLCHAWAFAHLTEFVWVVCALASNTHVVPSNKTMGIFHLLHPFVEVEFSPFVDFHPEMEVILDWEVFIFTLVHSPHIFFDGP
jgi:hypothetical protein